MSTPFERERATEQVIVQDTETVETAPLVEPPVAPPVPPPPVAGYPAGEEVVVEEVAGAHYETTATGERVLVEDPGGTRVVTSDVRRPLPPDEDPRRWNWLTPALVFILLAALGIVLAAVVLSRNDDKKANDNATPRTNTVTTTVRSNPTPPPASVSVQVPSVVGQTRSAAERALDNAGLAIVVATVPGAPPAGSVLAQNPPAGQTLKSGDRCASTSPTAKLRPRRRRHRRRRPQTPTTQNSTTPAATPPATSHRVADDDGTERRTLDACADTGRGPVADGGDVKTAVQTLAGKNLAASHPVRAERRDDGHGRVAVSGRGRRLADRHAHHAQRRLGPRRQGAGYRSGHVGPDDQAGRRHAQRSRAAPILVKKDVADKEQAGKVVEQTPAAGSSAPKRAQVLVYMGAFKG